ncbi:Mic19p KNAG_0C01930 [Huiozyma naganishii CBS 8797]|uniref:MICOS complex subunit MIC19 n=1 Tax=Huiozyma naganishii (strain ATCC MYA-139 / BCRC 22969 / CBS 8797 / KCTC 17520 / NBRC 10181 / NCYC 3082 / Yp74L-3) TaxID=1071383 RepID=J7S5Q3_HUIN7|nr:hypothetical protein KNAG_0C01930 [Kazachstania naganishii CBS 8797]CCK69306.1 hypothetical protein KNAG_0C01930 [Kazachstania naganishii CBS 8797]
MGAQASKPEDSAVFAIDSTLKLSDDIVSKLQHSTETDFSRREDAERFIEEKVAQKLTRLEKDALRKFEDTLDTSLILTEIENDPLSSKKLDAKILTLSDNLKKLDERDEQKLKQIGTKGQEVRNKLAQCLADNKGKPLNCYEYIEQFKKIIG